MAAVVVDSSPVHRNPKVKICQPLCQPTVITSDHGYFLEDVSHLADYVPDLHTRWQLATTILFVGLSFFSTELNFYMGSLLVGCLLFEVCSMMMPVDASESLWV